MHPVRNGTILAVLAVAGMILLGCSEVSNAFASVKPTPAKTVKVEKQTVAKKQTTPKPADKRIRSTGGKLKLQLQWYPQAQFAGYIMAKEKGFFAKQGLNVELEWGGSGYRPIDNLNDGKVNFCTAWLSEAIYQKQKGKDICLLTQLMPNSSMMIVAKKSSGIKTPQDLNGKKVGLWGGDFKIAPTAFFKKYNIKPIYITQTFSVLPFLRGAVDAASAMRYNEYHKLMEAGLSEDELITFSLAEDGLNLPEDGLYCKTAFRENNPEICEKMIKAIKQGWQYSFDHKDETLQTIVRYCQQNEKNKVNTNSNHQKWMLNTMEKLIPMTTESGKTWGHLDENTYDKVIKLLMQQKMITTPPAYEDLYKPILPGGSNIRKEASK